jgi:hypothetical protein
VSSVTVCASSPHVKLWYCAEQATLACCTAHVAVLHSIGVLTAIAKIAVVTQQLLLQRIHCSDSSVPDAVS